MSSKKWRHVVGLERMTSHLVMWHHVWWNTLRHMSSVNGDMWSRCRTCDVTRPWSDVMYCGSGVHDVTCLLWCLRHIPVFFTLEPLQLPLNQFLVQSPLCTDDGKSEIANIEDETSHFRQTCLRLSAPYLYYHTRTHRICRCLSHLWTTFHLQPRHNSQFVTFSTE